MYTCIHFTNFVQLCLPQEMINKHQNLRLLFFKDYLFHFPYLILITNIVFFCNIGFEYKCFHVLLLVWNIYTENSIENQNYFWNRQNFKTLFSSFTVFLLMNKLEINSRHMATKGKGQGGWPIHPFFKCPALIFTADKYT